MKVKKELTPVVLEALGHLPLGQEQSKEVQNKVLQSLKNSPVEFLPVISKFLLFNQNFIMSDFDEVRLRLFFLEGGVRHGECPPEKPSLNPVQKLSDRTVTPSNLTESFGTYREVSQPYLK